MNKFLGKQLKIKCTNNGLCTGQTAPYPFWNQKWIPVFVTAEYPNFIVVQVEPHEGAWDETKPYTVTIDKVDIDAGMFKIKGADSDE